MNLVENNMLGRSRLLLIWRRYCIVKSALAAFASMNLLSIETCLSNRDVSHSKPAEVYHDRSTEMLSRVGVMHIIWPKPCDMYPLGYSGYIDTVKRAPLTLTLLVYWCTQLKSFLQVVWTNTLSCFSQTSFGLVEYRPSNWHLYPGTDCSWVQWLQLSTWLIRNSKVVSPQQKE